MKYDRDVNRRIRRVRELVNVDYTDSTHCQALNIMSPTIYIFDVSYYTQIIFAIDHVTDKA